MADETEPDEWVDIVFDGPPSHIAGRFVEVENEKGASIRFGEWVERPDGFWALRIHTKPRARIFAGIAAECEKLPDVHFGPMVSDDELVDYRRKCLRIAATQVKVLEALDRKASNG